MLRSLLLLGLLAGLLAVPAQGQNDPQEQFTSWDPRSTTHAARALLQTAPSFPYCRCEEYSCNVSPYQFSYPTVTPIVGGAPGRASICVTISVRNAAGCTASQTDECCSLLWSSLSKVGVRTATACRGAVTNATLDGRRVTWEFESTNPTAPDASLKAMALRLNGTILAARPSVLCFTVTEACNTLVKFTGRRNAVGAYYVSESSNHKCCPVCTLIRPTPPPPPPSPLVPDAPNVFVPPPPPPGPDFPFCKCRRAPGGYRLVGLGASQSAGRTTWSFRIETRPGTTWPLFKIEMWLRTEARGAIKNVTVNGVGRSASYAKYEVNGQTYTVFKITPLRLAPAVANGTVITFSARSPPYQEFLDLFVAPVYSMFSDKVNTAQTLCPTYRSIANV